MAGGKQTDEPKIKVYAFGQGGVNLVKGPLQLSDDELLQGQNAEIVRDQNTSGDGVLSKRGGLQPLNADALAGSVTGLVGLNVKTNYTRTLYVMRGSEDANTFRTTTDGTTWTDTGDPLAPAINSKFTDADGERDARRMVAFRNAILYPYDTYTKGTDKPILALWDGAEALQVTAIPFGPSATSQTPAYAIVDMLTANGQIYFAIHDPGGSGVNLAGRVMSLDLATGAIKQVAAAFGSGTGETTGGYPSCLAFYQGQLYAGLQGNSTTDGIGKIVRCLPDVDTTWTTDVSNLSGFPCSMAIYKGELFVGTRSSTSSNCKVYKRTASAGTYDASFTSSAGAAGTAFCGALIVYNDELYCCEYFSGATDVVHIKKFDNSSWTTDRDVDSSDSTDTTTPQMPGGSILFGSDLYFVFRANAVDATNGFVLRKSGGSWSKVDTDNYNGSLAVLVERS